MTYKILIIVLGAGLLSGCVSLARNPGFSDVDKAVHKRMEVKIEKPDKKSAEKIPGTIRSLFEQKLTVDEAVKVALLNNRELQATFEELGIAKADVLEATLVKNPVVHNFVRYGEEGNNTEFELTQDVISIILMPLRRRIASAQFEQTKLRVADAVLSLIAEVKTAYYEAQAAEQFKAFQQTVLEAAEAAVELSDRQHTAGNIRKLDLANQQAAYEQALLDLNQTEALVIATREPVNRLLGLQGNEVGDWQIESSLPELPAADPAPDNLENKALSQRLDLAAVKKQVEVFRRALLASRLGIIPTAEAGFNTEKDTDGERLTGPAWSAEIPVFNWQQANWSRSKAQIRQGRYAVAAFETQVRSGVRLALNQLKAARYMTERYRDKIIPLRAQILNFTLQQYNYMLMGVYDLLLARQNEIQANRAYIESLKEYWIAWTELEHALGGKLPYIKPATNAALAQKSMQASQAQGTQASSSTAGHQYHHGGHQS